jgi:hypothetical protein
VPHVFVESNWLFAYAAPAHHQIRAAVELLDRARQGEFTLHLPNLCLGEAREAILAKCQPRKEATALRQFLSWSEPAGIVTHADAVTTRATVEKFENSVKRDLGKLDAVFQELAEAPHVRIFGLDEQMLQRATRLALDGIAMQPFDQAILASVLVRSSQLWDAGERRISFRETDADLKPWDKYGTGTKSPLSGLPTMGLTSGSTETSRLPVQQGLRTLSDSFRYTEVNYAVCPRFNPSPKKFWISSASGAR